MRTTSFHRSKHLAENELLRPLEQCIICGGSFSAGHLSTLQESPNVYLLHCASCGAYSASRMPTETALSEYYSTYFDHFDVAPKVTHDSPQRFSRHMASFIETLKPHFNITDFGGGDGTIAYTLAQILCSRGARSANIIVVDYAEALASQDKRIEVQSISPNSPIPRADIILASGILEHIPDMFSSLVQLLTSLNRSGILYVRTPAVSGFMKVARTFGTQLDFTFPGHVHDLGQDFWEKILNFVPGGNEFKIVHSAPSLVETDFRHHPGRTLAAYVAKAPWRFLGRNYTLVGGWEVVFART